MVKVSLIGWGNVATSLYNFLSLQADFRIEGIYVRNPEKYDNSSAPLKKLDYVIPEYSSIVVICVSDAAIEEVSNRLVLNNKNTLVLHTSGNSNINLLDKHKYFGVLWPLQTITLKSKLNFTEIPFFIDFNNTRSKDKIISLCQKLNLSIEVMEFDKRQKMHLAAVMSNNFCNHLISVTKYFMKNEGLDFRFLKPILEETIYNNFNKGHAHLQTGPAVRGDLKTINNHLSLLENDKRLYDLYDFLSKSIKAHQTK